MTTPPKPPAHSIRRAAGFALAAIERGKKLEEAASRFEAYPARDRNFARAMTLTCLRRRGEIEQLAKPHMRKALPRKAAMTRALLQLGIAQIAFMGVPPHAAINETVGALARHEGHFRGFLNAVLRKIEPDNAPASPPDINMPSALYTAFCDAYGDARAAQIAQAHTHEPPLDLYFKTPALAQKWMTQYGAELNAQHLTPHSMRLPRSGNITELPDYARGNWWIQDVAASLAACLWDTPPQYALDLCAAPGGKTCQLAAQQLTIQNAELTALDISPARLTRLHDNLTRAKLSADIVQADALTWSPPRKFTHILLDAPCSATGTMRRNPDILWHYDPDNLTTLCETQAQLLTHAAQFLEPAGILIYCVCSLLPQEGEDQIAAFLDKHPQFSCAPIEAARVPSHFAANLTHGMLRTFPMPPAPYDNMIGDKMISGDGFFIARLIRKI